MKKATTVFIFGLVNATWLFMANILYATGLRPLWLAVSVIVIGAALGNLTVYAGFKIFGKLLRKPR
jgi:membrane protein DedA with SNARE-associated domain